MVRAIYPSYKDLDPFIDVEWLRSLNGYIEERIVRRLTQAADTAFYTGPFLLSDDAPKLPGSRMISLAQSVRAEDYYDLDRTELWHSTEDAEDFAELMDFIATLPFAATGRMLIMYDELGRPVTAHRDHDSTDLCHEFIWFRTNFAKPFFMLNPETAEKIYVRSHAAWFDTVNQFHGADAAPGLSFSIRVDGVFTDAFRSQIPFPVRDRSAAPALWAAQECENTPAIHRPA